MIQEVMVHQVLHWYTRSCQSRSVSRFVKCLVCNLRLMKILQTRNDKKRVTWNSSWWNNIFIRLSTRKEEETFKIIRLLAAVMSLIIEYIEEDFLTVFVYQVEHHKSKKFDVKKDIVKNPEKEVTEPTEEQKFLKHTTVWLIVMLLWFQRRKSLKKDISVDKISRGWQNVKLDDTCLSESVMMLFEWLM